LLEATLYNLALAHVYLAQRLQRDTKNLRKARDYSGLLVHKTLASLGLSTKWDERKERLREVELPSLVLYAGVLVLTYPSLGNKVIPGAVKDTSPEMLTREELDELLNSGGDPPEAELAYDIIERYVRRQPSRSSRTSYNLACFYARIAPKASEAARKEDRAACLSRALTELALALDDAGLVYWAARDPSLDPLSSDSNTKSRFKQLIVDRTPAGTPDQTGNGKSGTLSADGKGTGAANQSAGTSAAKPKGKRKSRKKRSGQEIRKL
jgi:hypothetical protein